MEIPKVYKALVKTRAGRLVSIWAETLLDYHEGEVTYAPKGSMGIFIRDDLGGAVNNGKSNSRHRCKELEGTLVVHEATPLGNLCSKAGHSTFLVDDRYPAILLGKEVWRDEPTELERLCEARVLLGGEIRTCIQAGLHFCPEGRKYALYRKHGIWALYEGSRHLVATKDTLQEVVAFVEQDKKPKEEWVDITDEVTLYPFKAAGGILVSICDGEPCLGNAEIWLGSNGAEKIHPKDLRAKTGKYKIEPSGTTTSDGCAYFRVLKKVV